MTGEFLQTTADYERWRARRIPVVADDTARKHEKLAVSPFVLLRGTYYRFLQQFEHALPDCAAAPRAVCVGDLHIENFGTWRDAAGRLAWGINDFDELDVLPYTVDLVRLATSALLAIRASHLALHPEAACAAILDGWRARIELADPVPYVLAERHVHLYRLASEAFTSPVRFARNLAALPPFAGSLPRAPARLLREVTPWAGFEPQLRRRTAGVGSLGATRIVAFADCSGGLVVREAKQIPGPASLWLRPDETRTRGLAELVRQSRGCAADPARRQTGKWVMRPLAPDAARLELATLKRKHNEAAFLGDMGAEAANVHLVAHKRTAALDELAQDADQRGAGWLHAAAERMAMRTERDYADWASARRTV